MPHSLRKLIAPALLASLLLWVAYPAFAQNTPDVSSPPAAAPTQDPAQTLAALSKQLDDIKTAFNSKDGNASLNDLRNQAGEIQQQADQLVQTLTPELESLQTRLTVLGPAPAAGAGAPCRARRATPRTAGTKWTAGPSLRQARCGR